MRPISERENKRQNDFSYQVKSRLTQLRLKSSSLLLFRLKNEFCSFLGSVFGAATKIHFLCITVKKLSINYINGEMKVITCVIIVISFICIGIVKESHAFIHEQGKILFSNSSSAPKGETRQGRIFFNLLGLPGIFGGGGSDLGSDDLDFDGDSDEDDAGKTSNCTCECGLSNHENRIVGGRPTGINLYPWIARIVYDGRFHCGASLVAESYVITAAHCVRKLKRSKIRVILGDHDMSTTADVPAKMRAVSAIIRHRNFDTDTYNHDIALLKLRKKVEFSNSIRPICLPANKDPAGKQGTVVGWGRTSEGGAIPSVVQEVEVPILTLNQCRAMKYRASRITTYMLCAGKGKQDSCQGDSGGPLLVHSGDKYEIVGIVSWGVGCGRPGYPGVYTRVARYLNWLNLNIEDECICR